MLVTFIAWIYITFLSYSWGKFFLNLAFKNLLPEKIINIHPCITCFTGLIFITGIAGMLSFFSPLGSLSVQLIFFLPALFMFKKTFKVIHARKRIWLPVNLSLFACCFIVVLTMCTYTISHPDSLGYHIQIIKWIENYKIIPGIANLNARLGFQSNWFVACALFNFKFVTEGSYVYLNSLVTLWLLFFVISRINFFIIQNKQKETWLWIIFMVLTLTSYAQVMLTATSASPDYITAIYIWLAFYFLYNANTNFEVSSLVLVIIFSSFAICLKLSALPVIITGAYALIKLISKKRTKDFILPVATGVIIVVCFLLRNIVTSGYMLYPATFPDIVAADWKVPLANAKREQAYVTAFARTESGGSDQAIAHTNNMKLGNWIPLWWNNRKFPDKTIIVLASLSFLTLIIFFNRLKKQKTQILVGIITSSIGTVFWFLLGPDPRFGFGFIIGLIGLTASLLTPSHIFTLINQKFIFLILLAFNIVLVVYLIHRYRNYFSEKQIVYPLGVKILPSSPINCDGMMFNLAAPSEGCGSNPVPCIENSCENFSSRGNAVADGFKPKTLH